MLTAGLIVVIGFLSGADCGQWTSAQNGIPQNAFDAGSYGNHVYYCQVTDGGQIFTGTTNKSVCDYAKGDTVASSGTYDVLTITSTTKWKYAQQAPVGAVSCNQGTGCYVTYSVSGDGICRDLPGRVLDNGKSMQMVSHGRVFKCGFKLYLVEL